ncbi:M28 family peptidase [Neisseria sp. Ec49-e6-T10]|uniref:M28 family peptidase n=1 Tax=Neisseria sp. Ec49-e6-T10 TaxID=3140744 RepID=UPI003EBC7C28
MFIKKLFKYTAILSSILLLFFIGACTVLKQPDVQPKVTEAPLVQADSLKKHVYFFSETVYPRSFDSIDHLNLAADYIKNEFVQTGAQVTEQTFEVDGVTYRNIIASFGPQNAEPIIVGAHYDSCTDTPGADDNASGVAGLIELAKLLGKNKPKHPIQLIAYTLEEPPYFRTENMGSAVHARSIKVAGQKIKLMISLEMIGYFSDEENSQEYPMGFLGKIYPTTGHFIAIVGRFADIKPIRQSKSLFAGATDLPVYSLNAPAALTKGLDFSDHLNYWANGFNAIMVTDTAFFRNKNYHQVTDTVDTLDYQRMAKVVQGVYAIIQHYE